MWGFRHAANHSNAVIGCSRVLIALGACILAHSAFAEPRAFEVPAGNAATELRAFAKQAGLQILFDFNNATLIRTHAVSGKMEPEAALTQMIQGTGLEFERVNGQTIAIREAKPVSTNPQTPAVADPTPTGVATQAPGSVDLAASGLQEITVTGRYEFLSADTSGTTNLPVSIEQVPQSISLVSNDFIEAADLKTLGAIAEYTPGAINAGNEANLGTSIRLRGFAAGQSIDGIPVLAGTAGTFFEPDNAVYDRLEIVKGPSSVMYGISSPGGLVNYVTKNATAQTPSYLLAQIGSWSGYRIEGQIAGALNTQGNVHAIGIAVHDQGDSFVDDVHHDRTSVYAGLNADLGNSVTAYVHGGYERQSVIAFDGVPTEIDGSPPPLPRSFFVGGSTETTTEIAYEVSDLTWHATDMLDLSIKDNYQTVRVQGGEGFGADLQTNGNLATYAQYLVGRNSNYGIGLSTIYKFDGLGLKNSFVSLAALYQSNAYRSDYNYNLNPGTANIFDGQAAVIQAFDSLLAGPLPAYMDLLTKEDTLTLSGQSMLQVMDPLTILLGVSYSKPKISDVVNGLEQDFPIDGQVSYRAGITYEFLPKTYAYVSYSQSFDPQSYLSVNGDVLPPITGEQYEAGLKYRNQSGHLLLTAAGFQIKEKNVAQYSTIVNGTDYYVPAGELTHTGFELQAIGQIMPNWQINASYTYLDPKITQSVPALSATAGETELFIPKQTASAYTTYTLKEGRLRGLSLGGGIRYVGSEHTSYTSLLANQEENPNTQTPPIIPTKDLAGYAVVDATIGYTIDKWLVQLNGHNILDRRYYINTYQTLYYGNVAGDPANIALSVRRTF